MRVAVISDVHGNLAALEAVLEAIEADRVDAIWFLGDAVGYGPRPDDVCRLLEERTTIALAGNHDLAVTRPTRDLIARFNPAILPTFVWMGEHLSQPARAWLDGNEPVAEAPVAGVGLYHASPRDPVWEYVLNPEALRAAWAHVTDRLILVGHSHVPFAYAERQELRDAWRAAWFALGDERWVLNPGSVGQPRDGDPRASFLLLDLPAEGSWRALFRRVPYTVERTRDEILAIDVLPDAWGHRLLRGQ